MVSATKNPIFDSTARSEPVCLLYPVSTLNRGTKTGGPGRSHLVDPEIVLALRPAAHTPKIFDDRGLGLLAGEQALLFLSGICVKEATGGLGKLSNHLPLPVHSFFSGSGKAATKHRHAEQDEAQRHR